MTAGSRSSRQTVTTLEEPRGVSLFDAPSLPLIDRIGGLPVVAWIADRFVERILDDPELAMQFATVDVAALKASHEAFFIEAFGGHAAAQWNGSRVLLDGEQLARMVLHLNDTLDSLGLTPPVVEQIFYAVVARAMAGAQPFANGTALAPQGA